MDKKGKGRKVSHMGWMLIQITEITSYFSNAHLSRSPGNVQIKNYWLKAFPATHRHIKKTSIP